MQHLLATFAAAYGPDGRKWSITRKAGSLLIEDPQTLRTITLDIRPDNAVLIAMRNGALGLTYRIPGPDIVEAEQHRALAVADLFLAHRVEQTTPALAVKGPDDGATAATAIARNRPVAWRWS